MAGKLSATQIRLMKILPFFCAPFEHFGKFDVVVALACFICHVKIGVDAIGNVFQQHGCALLTVVFNIERAAAFTHFGSHFVTADIRPQDRF